MWPVGVVGGAGPGLEGVVSERAWPVRGRGREERAWLVREGVARKRGRGQEERRGLEF